MPAYEYACKDCNHDITVFLSLKEFEAKPKIKCAHCQIDNVQKKARNLLQGQTKHLESQQPKFKVTAL